MTYDVVVVGLGGVGSATAAALARRGQRVLGLDRYAPVHDQGASHGETRIVRKAYFEGEAYVPLLHRAYELWDELGLLTRTGGLFLGGADSHVLAGSVATARAWDLPHELLDAAEVTRRFPAFTPPRETVAMYEVDSGFVSPEAAVSVQLRRAAEAGADLRHGEPAVAWEATPNGVRVVTHGAVYDCGWAVLAPGRWSSELLQADLPLQVQPRTIGWYAPRDPAAFALGRLPVWIWERGDGTSTYGFPDVGTGVKTAIHHSVVREAASWRPADVARLLAPLFPTLGDTVLRASECTYTLTPDHHYVVGRHPHCDRVLVACGLSGHGFKLTPVLAEALTDLAVDGSSRHDLSLFDPHRF